MQLMRDALIWTFKPALVPEVKILKYTSRTTHTLDSINTLICVFLLNKDLTTEIGQEMYILYIFIKADAHN